ncbi:hypothetical protein NQ156_06720 [Microbacterium sp. zg.Y625]|uniref:hypothetical protein n=1 Tax=Microbacterium jiangjiandongii TaxID=3049071 RepID=UPI00214CF06B|nr:MULTISPECIES: hypothetical protein [unclassified Microbacterium]MCR2792754.1 hypothetical protein [Microbacterium sp. zg.Y625]WIM26732.1 hypothetical protein QNO14_06745 [Microbacterium sp. zg-Y625]
MLLRIETIAFVALLILTLIRLPSAIREPSSRLTWIATITGLAAIFMVGVAVPLHTVDGWLGGTNVANLVQNILATAAFWFVMQAALTLDGSRFNTRSLWELPLMCLAFIIPFLMIVDRGSTTDAFIDETADHFGLWAYASIYMGCVVLIMTRMLRGIHGRKPRSYIAIRVGAWAILCASLVEIVYLTLRVAGMGRTPPVEAVGSLFTFPFYGGVVLVCAGIIAFAIARAGRRSMNTALGRLLARASLDRGMIVSPVPDEDPVHEAYRLAVRLTDIANSQELTKRERILLRAATQMLDRQMRAPAVVRMSSATGTVTAP